MARAHQPDLFASRSDLFEDASPPVYRGDPDRVRARLEAIVAQARAADTLPWSRAETRLYATIVPQMVLWLPDDEAAQWRFAFATEMKRLQAS